MDGGGRLLTSMLLQNIAGVDEIEKSRKSKD